MDRARSTASPARTSGDRSPAGCVRCRARPLQRACITVEFTVLRQLMSQTTSPSTSRIELLVNNYRQSAEPVLPAKRQYHDHAHTPALRCNRLKETNQ